MLHDKILDTKNDIKNLILKRRNIQAAKLDKMRKVSEFHKKELEMKIHDTQLKIDSKLQNLKKAIEF